MRAAFVVGVLLSLVVGAQGRTHRDLASRRSARGLDVVRGSGNAVSVFGNFCDRLGAADKVGGWWCINADGTQPSGSVALTATGTPGVGAQVCAPVVAGNLGGAAAYKTGNVSQSAGGVTVCAVFKPDSVTGGTQIVVGHTNVAGAYTFSCDINGSGSFTCTARNTTPTTSTTGDSLQTAGVLKVLCGSYSPTDGIPRTYGDGIAATPGAALSPGALATESIPWHVGVRLGTTRRATFSVRL